MELRPRTRRRRRGEGTALLLVDWINGLDFPGSETLLAAALPAARATARLRRRADQAGVPVVYVNDNFDCWTADVRTLATICRRGIGRPLVDLLRPRRRDYFILKPKHSGFLHTPLELLLDYLDTGRLVFTGLAGNICVLFTAHDAHMRDFEVVVARDCVASNTPAHNEIALEQLATVVHAQVLDGRDVDFGRPTSTAPDFTPRG